MWRRRARSDAPSDCLTVVSVSTQSTRLAHGRFVSAVARARRWSGVNAPPRRTFLVGRRTGRRIRRAAGEVVVADQAEGARFCLLRSAD